MIRPMKQASPDQVSMLTCRGSANISRISYGRFPRCRAFTSRDVPRFSCAASNSVADSNGKHSVAVEQPSKGHPYPLGASAVIDKEAVNFAVFSKNADAVDLCLFTEADLKAGRVTRSITLDPESNRSGDIWHVEVPQLDHSLLYGYRLTGPHQEKEAPSQGHRFDPGAVVLDPYAKAILDRREYGKQAQNIDYTKNDILGLAPTWPQSAGSLPQPSSSFDWEGDQPLHLPMEDLIIYEMHVRGFTRDKSSRSKFPGTFAGMIGKLDYLQQLGVNAIELLPIHEFNELEYLQVIPGSNQQRLNYWGYSTTSFFAPMSRYSQAALDNKPASEIVDEFKTMVKECHKRGIEVILDVVFNHTAEGNEMGPTISFRGLDNRVYYMLAPEGQYYNYSGCGNTLNCNHPQVRHFILESLRYWVMELHIDGFRFDLASIMTRAPSLWHNHDKIEAIEEIHRDSQQQDAASPAATAGEENLPGAEVRPPSLDYIVNGAGYPVGTPLTDPALIEMISEDPVLRGTKLIAEAWDCDGLNQVGAFPHYGGRWAEWNGHFRDSVRQFVKGTEGPWAAAFAAAVCGSPNLYASPADESNWWGRGSGSKWRGSRGPSHSINFITAHDGFSLIDLVSFNEKHNDANGEQSRDGENNNLTWNCGAEGPTTDLGVQRLRGRQQRNLAAALLLSQGVPMILMGDEYGHSKGGNNNTYCHDSPLNWFNWIQAEEDKTGFARFFRLLVNLRRSRPELRQREYLGPGSIQWHGQTAGNPDWSESSQLVAYTLSGPDGGLYIAFNSSHLPVTAQLPHWHERQWQPVLDTSKIPPYDFMQADEMLSEEALSEVQKESYRWMAEGFVALMPRSCCVLDSVRIEDVPSHGLYSDVLEPFSLPSEPPKKDVKRNRVPLTAET